MESEQDQIRSYGLLGDAPVGEHYTWDGEDAANTDGLDRMAFVEVLAEAAVKTGDTLTIGVYGDWGEGKTSLMYLMKQVVDKDRNAIGVWFNAWQYEREDHLIVPLIATITRDINEALDERKGKLSQLSETIIRGTEKLKHALSSIASGLSCKIKGKVPLLGEAEVGISGKETIERYQDFGKDISEGKGLYFNSFEELRAIKNADSMPKIVVFIDDLDRCFPDAAVRLLENVKLVLSIPNFSFVLGVAPTVIQKFVERKFSKDLGLDEAYFRNYLDKFVQVPVHLPRQQGDMFETYVKRLLDTEGVLNLDEKMAFANLIGLIAEISAHNPRSAVRFINQILVLHRISIKQEQEIPVTDLTFASALQPHKSVFLSGRIRFPWLTKEKDSIAMFNSGESRNHSLWKSLDWPTNLAPEMEFGEGLAQLLESTGFPTDVSSLEEKIRCLSEMQTSDRVVTALNWLADYSHICQALSHSEGLAWLCDKRRIASSFRLTVVVPSSSTDSTEVPVYKRVREMDPFQIPEIIAQIEEKGTIRSCAQRFVRDLTPLSQFPQLTKLDLSGCGNITSLEPIASLSQLTELSLSGNEDITDIEPLAKLSKLTKLTLFDFTNETDLDPLSNLSELSEITFIRLENLTDITPLAKLSQMTRLNFWDCPNISSLKPLTYLLELKNLEIRGCVRISDLKPLTSLHRLARLCLAGCKRIKSIEPLSQLTQLTELVLVGCKNITEIEPLKNLSRLKKLHLCNCPKIMDLDIIPSFTRLEYLAIYGFRNKIDLKSLEKVKNLTELRITTNSGISDLTPLRNFKKLSKLNLSRCENITDIEPIATLPQLTELDLSGCINVTSLEPLVVLNRLKCLEINGCGGLTDLKSFFGVDGIPFVLRGPALQKFLAELRDRIAKSQKQ